MCAVSHVSRAWKHHSGERGTPSAALVRECARPLAHTYRPSRPSEADRTCLDPKVARSAAETAGHSHRATTAAGRGNHGSVSDETLLARHHGLERWLLPARVVTPSRSRPCHTRRGTYCSPWIESRMAR